MTAPLSIRSRRVTFQSAGCLAGNLAGTSQGRRFLLKYLKLLSMKNRLLAIAFTAVSGAAIAQEGTAIRSIPIGSSIPDAGVTLQAANGAGVSLGGAKTRQGLLVMFSCNTCPYVIRSQQRTREVMALAKKKGIGMVIVNSNEAQRDGDDSFEAMAEYGKQQGYTVPYVRDDNSRLANDFGSTRTPEVFLFDGSGRLVYHGAMEDNPSDPASSKRMYLAEAVDHMLTGKAIDPAETKSIGCSIKRK